MHVVVDGYRYPVMYSMLMHFAVSLSQYVACVTGYGTGNDIAIDVDMILALWIPILEPHANCTLCQKVAMLPSYPRSEESIRSLKLYEFIAHRDSSNRTNVL